MQASVASAEYFKPQWTGTDAKVGGGRRTDSMIYTILLSTGSHKDKERGRVTPNPPRDVLMCVKLIFLASTVNSHLEF